MDSAALRVRKIVPVLLEELPSKVTTVFVCSDHFQYIQHIVQGKSHHIVIQIPDKEGREKSILHQKLAQKPHTCKRELLTTYIKFKAIPEILSLNYPN